MKPKRIFAGAILLLLPLLSIAKEVEFQSARETAISIPDDSKIELDRKKSSQGDKVTLFFNGEVSLKGVLQIYWIAETENKKYLNMRFFPDKESLATLPTLKEWNTSYQPKIIDLKATARYKQGKYSYSEEKIKSLLKKQSTPIPENVFKYKERYALVPAVVRINKLLASGECGTRHFGADFLGVDKFPSDTTIEDMKRTVKDAGGCGTDFTEGYSISSKNGNNFEIKSAPDLYSDTTEKLPNKTDSIKLKTINDEWMYVQFARPGSTEGVLADPAYGYIYTPNLKLEFTN